MIKRQTEYAFILSATWNAFDISPYVELTKSKTSTVSDSSLGWSVVRQQPQPSPAALAHAVVCVRM